jgi:hypothetical protein
MLEFAADFFHEFERRTGRNAYNLAETFAAKRHPFCGMLQRENGSVLERHHASTTTLVCL